MKHCRPDWKSWEKENTCINCAHPLDENERVKELLKINTTAGWAKERLRILYDMASQRYLPAWLCAEIKKIERGIETLA